MIGVGGQTITGQMSVGLLRLSAVPRPRALAQTCTVGLRHAPPPRLGLRRLRRTSICVSAATLHSLQDSLSFDRQHASYFTGQQSCVLEQWRKSLSHPSAGVRVGEGWIILDKGSSPSYPRDGEVTQDEDFVPNTGVASMFAYFYTSK